MRLADFILEKVEPILAEWEVFARGVWPGGAAADPPTLRDHARDILRATAFDMKSAQTAAEQSDKSRGGGLRGAVHRAAPASTRESLTPETLRPSLLVRRLGWPLPIGDPQDNRDQHQDGAGAGEDVAGSEHGHGLAFRRVAVKSKGSVAVAVQ